MAKPIATSPAKHIGAPTPDEFIRLSKVDRAAISDEARIMVAAHQAVERLELRKRQRDQETMVAAHHAIDALEARQQAKADPESNAGSSQESQGESVTPEAPPDQRCGAIGMWRTPNGDVTFGRLRCKARGCIDCGDDWGHLNYDAAAELLHQERLEAATWYAYRANGPAEQNKFRQAKHRADKRHGPSVGLSLPGNLTGERIYITTAALNWGNTEQIDDIHTYLQYAILGVRDLARQWKDTPRDQRPNLGPVTGLGTWRTSLAEVKARHTAPPDEADEREFLGLVGKTLTHPELLDLFADLDIEVVNDKPNALTIRPTEVQLRRLFRKVGRITPADLESARLRRDIERQLPDRTWLTKAAA